MDAKEETDLLQTNNDKERLYVWSARAFESQTRRHHPRLRPHCLTLRNECGVEKLAPSFVRPTALPFSHLFSVPNCAAFVADYVFFRPLSEEVARRPPEVVASPTKTLSSQVGLK